MKQITSQMAEYLFRCDAQVFMLHPDEGTESLVEKVEEIQNHYLMGGIFGVEQ